MKVAEPSQMVQDFVAFLNAGATPFHVAAEAKQRLLAAGFTEVDERETFALKKAGRYFFTRNMSSIVAFAVGGAFKPGNGFIVVGAHTDSPCPKLKPVSKSKSQGYLMIGTQPYGGGLWHTWFDRDLSVAGRLIVKRADGRYTHGLVRIDRAILRIPTLAIHLTKGDERTKFEPNLQNNFYPVLASEVKAQLLQPTASAVKDEKAAAVVSDAEKQSAAGKHHPLLLELLAAEANCAPEDIEDLELQLCDTQPSAVGGALKEFIYSGRLDNLCSSWQGLQALIDSSDSASLEKDISCRVVALFDHEEVGSGSAHGAGGTLLPDALRRITTAPGLRDGAALQEDSAVLMDRALRKSFVVSADMAHALHPNYADRHDPALGPAMHKGMVIKHNANQRYATNAVTAFLFREVGKRAGLSTQEFAVRSDTGCGSTIGPIISTLCGVRTVDVGSPQWSMHSCREVMGVDDVEYGYKHLRAMFETFSELDGQLRVDASDVAHPHLS